jgi:hypothetical protein
MPAPVPPTHPLARMFAALTEQTFITQLGVTDLKLIDYLSRLLTRFVHMDAIFGLRSLSGKRLEEVAEMLAEAEAPYRSAASTREFHRHIGDFTLFWSGVYPEGLKVLRAPSRKDHLLDYCAQGKRSYWIASQFDDEPYREEAPVLRRLSEQFELCVYGLNRVRREWEKVDAASAAAFQSRLIL